MSNYEPVDEQKPNPYKEIKITVGGKDWKDAFGQGQPNVYFAENLKLYFDKNQGVDFSVSSKYSSVLSGLMEKFKNSTPGKIMGVIQKFSDVAGAISAYEKAKTSEGGASTTQKNAAVQEAASKIRVLPPNVRYQTKLQTLPAWEETSPLELGAFKFRFYMGMAGVWDARTEVYNPAIALMRVNQPIELRAGVLHGPLPSTAFVYGVIGKAFADSATSTAQKMAINPSASGVKSDEGAAFAYEGLLNNAMATFEDQLFNAIQQWPGWGLVQVSIGHFAFPVMSVARTRVTFSPDTDEHGFPIWADVDWSDCKSIEMATADQIPLIGDVEGNHSLLVSEYFGTPATAKDLQVEADRREAAAKEFRANAAAFDARDANSFKSKSK
jgi:hypothetical protein